MSARDPRIDPRPDDQVCVGEETREVCVIHNGRVVYPWPGKVAVRLQLLGQWRKWAEDGVVVNVADSE